MKNVQVEKRENMFIKIVRAIVIAFVVTLISIFIFAIVLTYTNVSESIVPVVIIFLTFISILIGTIISMRKISKNGMVNGAIIGGLYVISLYLISSILNTGFTMNIYTVITILSGVISGIIGGIIAVNT